MYPRTSLPSLSTLALLLLPFLFCSCGRKDAAPASAADRLPDTLRAVTLYGPTSYFIYKGEPMGYDYTLVDSLARQKGMVLDLKVARSLSAAVAMLDSGKVDLIAYEVPITEHYRQYVLPCGPENITTQVLVQPKVSKQPAVKDVTELVGKEVYVEKDSKYLRRLRNLNDELGGGIIIREVDADSLITEDLIEMVSDGKIPLTVVDSDIARLNSTYYPDLDVEVPVSFEQRSSWAVAPGKEWLADSIDTWFAGESSQSTNAELLKQLFEQSKFASSVSFDFSKGYKPGHTGEYLNEIIDRYDRGEIFSADSAKVDSTLIFHTGTGRMVYGGGGIMPDIFVPSDTTGVTSYYLKVANAGLLRNFAYEYADLNRGRLNESRDTRELLEMLPSDQVLLQSFVNYAHQKGGVAPRWYYINISAPLIVNQLKALIARDIVGMDGYFEIVNSTDPVVLEAVRALQDGSAAFPLRDN